MCWQTLSSPDSLPWLRLQRVDLDAASRTGTGGNGDVPRGEHELARCRGRRRRRSHKPYPIVLAHGFSGFHNIGPLTYFYGVQDALSKDGHEVFVTTVDPYNSSEVRGAAAA